MHPENNPTAMNKSKTSAANASTSTATIESQAPPIRFPVGVSDFKKLATGDYRFADKTLFIKEVMEDGPDIILITRPRRFGKTLSMSMLSYFLKAGHLEDRGIFNGLAISKHEAFCQQHQQKYPVIFISFKDVKHSKFDRAYADILSLVQSMYSQHYYLLNDGILRPSEKDSFEALLAAKATPEQIENSIRQLSEYLMRRWGKQAIILIDEYDTPIQEAYLHKYYDQMVEVVRGMLGKALKDNSALYKAVLTGITRVSQASLFSGLNRLKIYSLLSEKYGQYFGFTETEVIALSQGIKLRSDLNEIKSWYNGYNIGGHTIYNPWSIIMCLDEKGECKPYWLNTSQNGLLRDLFDKADAVAIRGHFEQLLQGKAITKPLMENLIFPELDRDESAIWSVLLYAGYLNVLSKEQRGHRLMAEVAVPNREVSSVYDWMVDSWFMYKATLDTYDELINSLAAANMPTFKRLLGAYLLESGSYFDFNRKTSEQVFQAFMLGLVVGLKNDYVIESNTEAGLGRLDVVFIPKLERRDVAGDKRRGILLEFKTCDELELMQARASEALQQIKDHQYAQKLNQHGVTEVLAIGLSFCGKQVELASEIIKAR